MTLLGAGVVAAGLASTLVESESIQRMSFALPAGLGCAIAAVVPRRWLLAVAAAIGGATLLLGAGILGFPLGRTAAAAVANATEAVGFAWLLQSVWPGSRRLASRADVARFFTASTLCAAVGATIAIAPFPWPGSMPEAWAVRFTGHSVAILAIAPAALLFGKLRRVAPLRWLEIGGLGLVLLATTEVGFDPHVSTVVFPYVPLGVMLVMVVRLQTPGAVVLPWALAPAALLHTTWGNGPFAKLTHSAFGRALAVTSTG